MAHKSGRGLSRLVTTAVAVALVGGTAGTAMAAGTANNSTAAKKPTAAAPVFPIGAITKADKFYFYEADGKGGLKHRQGGDKLRTVIKEETQVDRDGDGRHDGDYVIGKNGDLFFHGLTGKDYKVAANFGYFYRGLVSPGSLDGTGHASLVALGKGGTAKVLLTRDNGTITRDVRLGGKEWGEYVELAGRGDLTGDGKADMVARDTKGTLWLYQGTGNARKPFADRTRIGGGWGKYAHIFSSGDVNGDGHSDLLAVDGKGALWLYKGTGKASAPFKSPVKIGKSGWNQYRLVF